MQDHVAGNYDLFISKFDPTGTQLIYSTYLGGSAYDNPSALALDVQGNVYLTGGTLSPDFPLMNPLIGKQPGSADAFVSELDSTGSRLIFSTYLGGKGSDFGRAIALDPSGDIYIAGSTQSLDFPTTPGAFQTACVSPPHASNCGGGDAFLTKIDPLGSQLLYSTYLGGSASEGANGLVVDSDGHAYIAGFTGSPDFPTRAPYSAKLNGSSDAFITELNEDGSGLVFSTFFGGSGTDSANGLARDLFGNLYIVGSTGSKDLPTLHAFQTTNSGSGDAFVAKFNPSGDTLIYSSYLGGSGSEILPHLAVDAFGSIAVSGSTNSSDFPTVDAVQTTYGGGIYDLYIAKISPDGSRLIYSTYLGGAGDDHPDTIYSDLIGSVWVGGSTGSPTFPVVGAYQQSYAGGPYDAYLTEIKIDPLSIIQTLLASFDSNDYTQLLKPPALAFLRGTLDQAAENLVNGDTNAASKRLQWLLAHWDRLISERADNPISAEGISQLKQAVQNLLDEIL